MSVLYTGINYIVVTCGQMAGYSRVEAGSKYYNRILPLGGKGAGNILFTNSMDVLGQLQI